MNVEEELMGTNDALVRKLAEARAQIKEQAKDAYFTQQRLTEERDEARAQIAAIKDANQKQYDAGYAHGLSSRLGPSSEYVRELREENEKLKAALERRGEIIFGREGD